MAETDVVPSVMTFGKNSQSSRWFVQQNFCDWYVRVGGKPFAQKLPQIQRFWRYWGKNARRLAGIGHLGRKDATKGPQSQNEIELFLRNSEYVGANHSCGNGPREKWRLRL
jgi:hypothetical protein